MPATNFVRLGTNPVFKFLIGVALSARPYLLIKRYSYPTGYDESFLLCHKIKSFLIVAAPARQ